MARWKKSQNIVRRVVPSRKCEVLWKNNVFANMVGHYIYLEVSLLIGPDSKFIMKGHLLANGASHYIF